MPQEQQAYQRYDQELFAKLVGEVAYRILDQLGAVVHRYHFHALGQAGLQRL